MTFWPCHKCDTEGVRNLGIEGWCATHLEQLYTTFTPSTFALGGFAVRNGAMLPELGPGMSEVKCIACQATWGGLVAEPCPWCRDSLQRMNDWQAELILRPPDIDPDDERRPAALTAWAERMWTAVNAELITQRQAERALKRETHVAAA